MLEWCISNETRGIVPETSLYLEGRVFYQKDDFKCERVWYVLTLDENKITLLPKAPRSAVLCPLYYIYNSAIFDCLYIKGNKPLYGQNNYRDGMFLLDLSMPIHLYFECETTFDEIRTFRRQPIFAMSHF